jgi:hypothetical protein
MRPAENVKQPNERINKKLGKKEDSLSPDSEFSICSNTKHNSR